MGASRKLRNAKGRDLVDALVGVGPLAGPDGQDIDAADELARRELARPTDKADGRRWELTNERTREPCACGTHPWVLRNCRSGARVVANHRTPKGKPCPKAIGSVIRVKAAPAAAERSFPGEKFAIAEQVITVWHHEQAEGLDRNIEVTGQPWNREPVQLELFGVRR